MIQDAGKPLMSDGVICLRALEPEDTDVTFEWENDSSIWHLGDAKAPYSRRQIEEYIATYDADIFSALQLRLMITDESSGRRLGALDLYSFDPLNRRAAIGILVDRKERRNGIAMRAIMLCREYCRRRLGMKQLWALCAVDNVVSTRLFEKAGFSQSGVLKSWLRDGEDWQDVAVYQLIMS